MLSDGGDGRPQPALTLFWWWLCCCLCCFRTLGGFALGLGRGDLVEFLVAYKSRLSIYFIVYLFASGAGCVTVVLKLRCIDVMACLKSSPWHMCPCLSIYLLSVPLVIY